MTRRTSGPGLTIRVLTTILAVSALLSACGRSITSPEPDVNGSGSSFARPVRADQLRAPAAGVAESLAVAMRMQGEIEQELMHLRPGIVGTAASTLAGRPVVLALTESAVEGIPARVRGHEVVQFVLGKVEPTAYYAGTSTGRADECAAGTLGAIVSDGTRNYWLSNWHVFMRLDGAVGNPIVAPGRVDMSCGSSTTVGTVSRYVPLRFDGTPNYVDCAIARIVPGTNASAIQAAGSNSYLASATIRTATVGLAVKKVGRTTGFTTGKVLAVNVNLTIPYEEGNAVFRGVILFSSMANNGDSGSLISTSTGNNPVALVFAKTSSATVGCPIGAVFNALSARVVN